MKKLVLCALAALSGILVSCNSSDLKGSGDNDKKQDEKVTLSATFEQPASDKSKTVLTSDLKVNWVTGDQIKVWNTTDKSQIGEFQADRGESETVTFSQTGGAIDLTTPSASYYAFYPSVAVSSITSNNSIEFNIPQEQTYVENSFAQDANYAAAYGVFEDTGNGRKIELKFKNVAGVLRLGLGCAAGTHASISKIVLSDNGGKKLWGKFSYQFPANMDDTPLPYAVKVNNEDGGSTVVLKCDSPVVLPYDGTSVKDFYFTVPVGAFENGFTAEVYTDHDHLFASIATRSGVGGAVIERSIISKIPNVNVSWIPNDCTEYDYLQSHCYESGRINYGQFILTGYNPRSEGGMRIVFEGSIDGGVEANPSICGLIYTTDGGSNIYAPWISVDLHPNNTSRGIRVTANDNFIRFYEGQTVVGRKFKCDATFVLGTNNYVVRMDDGAANVMTMSNNSTRGLPGGNFTLFGSRVLENWESDSKGFENLSSSKIYYFKMYRPNGTIARYFIPVQNKDGVNGMCDVSSENHDFYTNPVGRADCNGQPNGKFDIGND